MNSVSEIASVGQAAITAMILLGVSSVAATTMDKYMMAPPLSSELIEPPMIMLTLASDHQLFLKAYNDYDDLTGDGVIETTYSHDFSYVGYFDHKLCYLYQDGVFQPSGVAAPVDPSDIGEPDVVLQYCDAQEWSGNFLNWATMTRVDLVRHVLYGGYRYVDDPNRTVLERAQLPHDAHSFAKHYDDGALDDIDRLVDPSLLSISNSCSDNESNCNGITFCNTSEPAQGNHFSHQSPSLNKPPLMRMVKGNFSLWGGGSRFQCLTREEQVWSGDAFESGRNGNDSEVTDIDAYDNAPFANQVRDLLVRIEVCGEHAENGAHKCKSYDEGSAKPVGLLQEYGEDDVQFGLMTRGYNSNKSYGVLRKNVSSLADEIHPQNGTLISAPESGSIIDSLNALRIVDYRYDFDGSHLDIEDSPGRQGDIFYSGTYLKPEQIGGENVIDNWRLQVPDADCAWSRNEFENGECRNWGNPFGLLVAESYRYFAGAEAPRAEGATDANLVPGLSVANWSPPAPTSELSSPAVGASTDTACLNMNVLAFNASAVSYDGDLANSTTGGLDIGNEAIRVADLTDAIGEVELIADKYFVGAATGAADEAGRGQCTAKEVANLSQVRGTCPDAPRLEGSYAVAGLAHYVHTNDVRPNRPGKSTIATYGVDLAGALPNIQVPLDDGERGITIIPSCHNKDVGGNCAIVDFKPIQFHTATLDGGYEGKYLVVWEDSEQGGDYDQDLMGIIKYKLTSNSIEVFTQVVGISSTDDMNFGFVISGTNSDGYYPATMTSVTVNDDGYITDTQLRCDAPGCVEEAGWQKLSFNLDETASGVSGELLEGPLYYAAKWGSYPKQHGEPTVDDDAAGYAKVTNPAKLEAQLRGIFDSIINRPATGAAAAIASSTLSGEGFIVQTLYQPTYSDGENTISWVGTLNGLLIDSFGNLRESPNGSMALTDANPVVEFYYAEITDENDQKVQTTLFNRYPFDPSTGEPIREGDGVELGLELDELKPLWSARDRLADVDNVRVQRPAGTLADARRYIFTGLDASEDGTPDGQVTADEVVPFTQANAEALGPVLSIDSNLEEETDGASESLKLINYIRGEDQPGYRSRTVTWGEGEKVWRLGDIVHSTPAVVGRPSAGYDITYDDESYRQYKERYLDRRQMVYVGGNDGMLHAFNAGFYDSSIPGYDLSRNGEDGHALGAEMWAYVPYNLLPHLKWLSRPDYAHAYYVDGAVQTFDVNIFENDINNTYPNGWGTILVVGMRLGGGDYAISEEQTLKSAYIIMDVTNPEAPPKLIAEVTHEDLGFTLGNVSLVKSRKPATEEGAAPKNEWHLLLGSGPDSTGDYKEGISSQPAKVFSLDLKEALNGNVSLQPVQVDAAGRKSFVGGLTSIDWDGDYEDDMTYFGLVGDHGRFGNGDAEEDYVPSNGALKHAEVSFTGGTASVNNIADLLSPAPDLPFSTAPRVVRDRQNNFWVFSGSGRFLVTDDLDLDLSHRYFGIRVNDSSETAADPWHKGSSISLNDLHNVTEDRLLVNSVGAFKVMAGGVTSGLDEYLNDRQDGSGWYRDLTGEKEANFTRSALSDSTLVFNGYLPDVASCQQAGVTKVYALDMFSGLPQYRLKTLFTKDDTVDIDGETHTEVDPVAIEVDGVGSEPTIINEEVYLQNDRGEIESFSIETDGQLERRSWREIPSDELQ